MTRTLRLLARVRRLARRALCGSCYGAIVALGGFYGLFTAAALATATTVVACVCWALARE